MSNNISLVHSSQFLDWNSLYHNEINGYYEACVRKRQRNIPGLVIDNYNVAKTTSEKLAGDVVVDNMRACLRSRFGVKRSETQVKVHQACLEAMVPYIYGDEWKRNKARILKKFRVKEIRQEVLIIMSRRQGKTWSTAMYVAACLLNIPNVRIAVWATAYRLSRALMEIVKGMLEKAFVHHYNKKEYKTNEENSERFSFYGPDGSERILLCLPGSAKVSWRFFSC